MGIACFVEKEMATHSSVLAWRIPGTEEPGGLPSTGSHRVGHDWSSLAAAVITTCFLNVMIEYLHTYLAHNKYWMNIQLLLLLILLLQAREKSTEPQIETSVKYILNFVYKLVINKIYVNICHAINKVKHTYILHISFSVKTFKIPGEILHYYFKLTVFKGRLPCWLKW